MVEDAISKGGGGIAIFAVNVIISQNLDKGAFYKSSFVRKKGTKPF